MSDSRRRHPGEMLLRSRRLILDDDVTPGAVHVVEGRIAAIVDGQEEPPGLSEEARQIDVGDLAVMAGVVDTHVHVNDPGRAEWEGFECATRAAAAGGVTTLVDMPLNSVPPTVTAEALAAKRRAAHDRIAVDVGFWGGLVPQHLDAIEALAEAGVLGFKAFLVDSGVPEFPAVTIEQIEAVAARLVALGLPLLVHAEDAALIAATAAGPEVATRSYAEYLATRPAEAECRAIEGLLGVVERTGLRLHVVHLASARALPALRRARDAGLPVTTETCPHYLTFAAEEIGDGATPFKCAPPIRGTEDREALWRALTAGDIDLVASDHSPSPASEKCLDSGDFLAAWGGIASLQVALAATWTGAARRGLDLTLVTRLLSLGPARLAGLEGVKGRLAVGYDADLVIWDPEAEMEVEAGALAQRHPICPYDGLRLRGIVERTYVRGIEVHRHGETPVGFHGRTLAA